MDSEDLKYVVCSVICDSFVIGIVLIVVFCIISKRFNVQFMKIEETHTFYESNVSCTDPNCVRCSKYAAVLKKAHHKLTVYTACEYYEQLSESLNADYISLDSYSEQKPNVLFYRRLKTCPVWDTFQETSIIESYYKSISKEFESLISDDNLMGWKRNNTPQGSWDVFPLINQGIEIPDNCSRCPDTMEMIRAIPAVIAKNVFGNVMFSVVYPSTVIEEHYGPCNIRLRCHLGLVTPPGCTLRVAEQTLGWFQGRCLVFDDSFLHSVSYPALCSDNTCSNGEKNAEKLPLGNEGREFANSVAPDHLPHRAVLIIDLWHPDLSQQERNIFDDLFSPA